MKEEVISSGTAEAFVLGRSSSPPQTPAASSAGASSPAMPTNIGSTDWFGSAQGSKAGSCIGPPIPRTSLSTNAGGSSEAPCRPWERGDLLRRLATFKPSNWFGKPKGASSLDCARRGWIIIDTDKIECESCFAILAFGKPAEVDSAGEIFSEQLDMGHKSTCPWRGNCCADSLVQFPPTPPSALIGGYKDRYDGLLQFPALPIIASSAIEKMRLSRGAQIDRFLLQSITFLSGDMTTVEFSRDDASNTYYHAQKLISLCGWEPRWLPNVQDFEEHSTQSARNPYSFSRNEDEIRNSNHGSGKNAFSVSVTKNTGKRKKRLQESRCNSRSPLLDCSLCGATVRIWDFITVPRPARFGPNNIDAQDTTKKLGSRVNGWAAASGVEKERIEERDEAATTDDGKSLSNAGVDLNLTMAGRLPSARSGTPAMTELLNDVDIGRGLMIGQPTGSEVGDQAASYESRGPSTRKQNIEEGGSTVDRPHDRIQQADSMEGTVIDRDGDEVDDSTQDSDGPSKRARGISAFDAYHLSGRIDSSGAGPSRTLCFDIDIDVNRVDSCKEGSDIALGFPSTRDSARASSVIAMDTIGRSTEEDSMESVENYPGDNEEIQFPSPSMCKNLDMNDMQQSACAQPAAGSVAREMGVSSTNEGEEILNAETASAHARGDRISFGISGGSVGMGASHEAEIHGVDISVHRAESVVGDAEPIAEVTENLGQTGESAPGPGLMDEFIPEEMDREDAHGDSQDVMSHSLVRADSGSKIYGSTKADSVESEKKVSHALGHEGGAHPSLSCNAVICSGYEASKDEVTQTGKASVNDDFLLESDYVPAKGTGPANGENDYEVEVREFDPIKHHNICCPWVNGDVAAAGCGNNGATSSSISAALSGWQLTLDALDTLQSTGHVPMHTIRSESAASLCKDEHMNPSEKLLRRRSASKGHRQH